MMAEPANTAVAYSYAPLAEQETQTAQDGEYDQISDEDTMMDPHFPQNDVVDGDLALRIHWSQEAVAPQALALSTSTLAMRPDFSSAADEVDTISGERLEAIHQFIIANLSALKGGTSDHICIQNLQIPVVSGNESARFSKSAESSPPGTVCIVVKSKHTNRPFAPNRDGTPNPLKWTKKEDRLERTVGWTKRKAGADDDLVYAPPPPACISDRALDQRVSRVQEDEGFRVGRCGVSGPLRAGF
jgi:hypothetical protein